LFRVVRPFVCPIKDNVLFFGGIGGHTQRATKYIKKGYKNFFQTLKADQKKNKKEK
jgi:hypothetical protein